ncbi:neural cell adhesion molecule 1-like [Argopecten irradians]|uniref:neural cell adhesion molecule 1-like n=1 Tax=Argopecten irradians TaxID=31199 RepID=UPI003710442B
MNAGNSITLVCSVAGGIPKPTIRWERDGASLVTFETWAPPGNKTMFFGRTSFTTSPGDNNACVVCVVHYQRSDLYYRRNITLDVHFPPRISLVDITVIDEMDEVSLLCNATSNPPATVVWTAPNGSDISTKTALNFTRIYRTDIGNYTCSAENTLGTHENKTDLYINAPPKLCLHQYAFTDGNQTMTIRCSATGIPTPTITWYKNKEMITGSATTSTVTRVGPTNPYLVVSTLNVSDTGDEDVLGYTCNVTNANGIKHKKFRIQRKLKCRCLSRLLRNCEPLIFAPEELDAIMQETKEELTVDKSQLTITKIKLISAKDGRTSSSAIGAVGVVILLTFSVILIACDAIGHIVIKV